MLLGERDDKGNYRLYDKGDYGFLKPKAHGRILAITFTNKATREMTTRIINELSLLADNTGKSNYLSYLRQVYGASERAIAEAARRALTDLLFNFTSFNVSTIDSFFQNVLHIFTRELDLPESFNLEIDDHYVIATAVGEMLGSINLPPKGSDDAEAHRRRLLKSWLTNYMEARIEGGNNVNLMARASRTNVELIHTISTLRGETFKTHSREILDYLSDPDRLERFSAGLRDSLKSRQDEITSLARGLAAMPEYELIPKTLRKGYLDRWSNGDYSYSPLEHKTTTLSSALEPDGKRHNKPSKGLSWSDDIDSLLLGILRLGMKYFQDAYLYKKLRKQIYLLGLFSVACRHIEDYCRENEAFLLGDTNSLLHKVICESEVPFVYERIGGRLEHFLIDEFQDTSEMQWSNLSPLLIDSLARGKDNLIIGDEKQCIYRFRNSNPELLGNEVQDEVIRRFGAGDVDIRGIAISENTNWRSTPEVVRFNNTLFTLLARQEDAAIGSDAVSRTFSGVIQQVAPKSRDRHGYVKMIFGPEKEYKPEAGSAAVDTAAQPGYETWTDDDVLRHLGEEIDRQLTAGFSPRDIAVLVRTHSQGQMVISYLLDLMNDSTWRHGPVEIMSSDALEIAASPAVQLVIGMLRLTTSPLYVADTSQPRADGEPAVKLNPEFLRNRLIHRYELSAFDTIAVTDESGAPVTDPDGNQVMRRLTPGEALEKAIAATSSLLSVKDDSAPLPESELPPSVESECPSLYTITEKIILESVPPETRQSEAAFLTAFQDLVSDFEEGGQSDVESFLKWWDTRGHFNTLPAPDGLDAIRVMTVHQSKGLEMSCVHIPFCKDEIVKFMGEEWYALDRHGFAGIDAEDVPPYIPLRNENYSSIPMLAGDTTRFRVAQTIDTLNVAYVAFTRAVDELIVYADLAGGRGRTLAKALYEAVISASSTAIADLGLTPDETEWLTPLLPELSKGEEWERGEQLLILGHQVIPHRRDTEIEIVTDESDDSSQPVYRCEMYDTPFYPGAPERPDSFDIEIPYDTLINEYRIERPADMSLAKDADGQGVFNISDERHLGNFLHDVLANVAHPDDLPLAMERAAHRRALTRTQWQPYFDKLTEALRDPRVAPWFDSYTQLMTERPLTAVEGVRRPDRVMIMPDGRAIVVDYKFGHLNKEMFRKYHDQVRDYMILLSECGYDTLEGYLYFPLDSKIIPIDW